MTKKSIFILIGSFVLSGAIFAEGTFVTEDNSKKGKRLQDMQSQIDALEETPDYLSLSKKEQVKIANKILQLEEEMKRVAQAPSSNFNSSSSFYNQTPNSPDFNALEDLGIPIFGQTYSEKHTQTETNELFDRDDLFRIIGGKRPKILIEKSDEGLPFQYFTKGESNDQEDGTKEDTRSIASIIDSRVRYDRFNLFDDPRKEAEQIRAMPTNNKYEKDYKTKLIRQYIPILNHGFIPAIVSLHRYSFSTGASPKPFCSGAIVKNDGENYKIVTALHCLRDPSIKDENKFQIINLSRIKIKVTESLGNVYDYSVQSYEPLYDGQKTVIEKGGFNVMTGIKHDWVLLNVKWKGESESGYGVLPFMVPKLSLFDGKKRTILGGYPIDKYENDGGQYLYYEECSALKQYSSRFETNCDAIPSQSGSPIFQIFGREIHLLGIMTASPEGKSFKESQKFCEPGYILAPSSYLAHVEGNPRYVYSCIFHKYYQNQAVKAGRFYNKLFN